MPHRNQGRKKSNFPAQSGILAGAELDYFVSGVNYRIAYTDFLAALGVTGTIEQDGAATGTPILDKAGLVNNIRNLENGPGVKASVSPENGVILEHNILAGVGGVALFADRAELTPVIKNLIAGAGITVSASDGAVTIAATAGLPTSDVIIVNSIADLPAAVANGR